MSAPASSAGVARVALVQFAPRFGEPEPNRARLLELCAGLEAELVVAPELATSGYRFRSREEAQALAEPASDASPTIATYREIARMSGALVVGGFAERGAGGACFNSAAIVTASGLLAVYRKLHLFGEERRWFAPGAQPPPVVWTRSGLRVGVMICFDWLFPEVARYLALEGADVIAHPANLVLPHCPDAMALRCLENGVFVATADRVGSEVRSAGAAPLRFIGRSQVVAPDGARLCALDETEERVALCTIEPARARAPRLGMAGSVRVQRRDDVLALSVRAGAGEGPVRRWRLVRHSGLGRGAAHHDLFIERGGRLLTWRLERPLAAGVRGARAACHRRCYLERTGALGAGRGEIEPVEAGWCRVLEERPGAARYRLVRADGSELAWCVDGEDGGGVARA